MKVILFDLGRTLEDQDVLLPGATEMLEAVRGLVDADGAALQIGLVSDYTMPRDRRRCTGAATGVSRDSGQAKSARVLRAG